MAIKQDRSDLPAPGSFPPDRQPRFLTKALDAWFESWSEQRGQHVSSGSRFSASRASGCTRAIAYYGAQLPADEEPEIADAWRFTLGDLVHDFAQKWLQLVYPGCEIEVREKLVDIDDSVGIADVKITGTVEELAPHMVGTPHRNGEPYTYEAGDTWVVSMELKSASAYPFKLGTTNFKGPPEGPKLAHVMQGALCAEALDADEMVVGWLALENLAKTWGGLDPELGGRDRFLAEWTYTRAEYLEICAIERQRINWLLGYVDKVSAELADIDAGEHVEVESTPVELRQRTVHMIPRIVLLDDMTPATIVDPSTGSAEVNGAGGTILRTLKFWQCAYCDYQKRCIADGQR